jgi:hypothetical protein
MRVNRFRDVFRSNCVTEPTIHMRLLPAVIPCFPSLRLLRVARLDEVLRGSVKCW